MFDKRVILIFAFFLFNGLKAQFGDSFPVLKFDVDTADFGIVNEGDTIRYDFWFTNVGNKNMVIRQAHPACGCTKPTHTQGIIKPGERGVIHVEFHSQGFGGQTVVKQVIILLVDGPENYARFKAKIVNKAMMEEIEKYKKSEESQADKNKKVKKKKKKPKKFKPLSTPDF